jgi:glutathione synthase/RimK-type ligase-like ATP-grasp enzyme
MKQCAFLTTDNLEEFFVYDDLVKPHLANLGWAVTDVSWHDENANYDQFDVVVVRSTWDYQEHPAEFVKTLEKIEASSAQLQNPFELLSWNFSKDYLRDLNEKGVPILPTIWLDEFDSTAILEAFSHFKTHEIIIKPVVSANADFTYRLTQEDFLFEQQSIKQALGTRPIMVQAFEKSIVDAGEYSLFYFAGEYSHTINKRPASGDFRVQEEHGGELASVSASSHMLHLAQNTIEALPTSAFYARIDMLDTDKGLAIIEVELIEPSLYFNMDENSARVFAEAINAL